VIANLVAIGLDSHKAVIAIPVQKGYLHRWLSIYYSTQGIVYIKIKSIGLYPIKVSCNSIW
tara:strand:+ start:5239 stop:5421 length:183 start_codon:yes stop_codon:yes gene_type:complete